jgi:hypothetical protein
MKNIQQLLAEGALYQSIELTSEELNALLNGFSRLAGGDAVLTEVLQLPRCSVDVAC